MVQSMQKRSIMKLIPVSVSIFSLLLLTNCGSGGGEKSSEQITDNENHTLTTKTTQEQIPDTIITHNGFTYESVTSPLTQRVWLDRNLGASRVCQALDDEECYGEYYQWGRDADGHEKTDHETINTLNSDILDIGHDKFITTGNISPNDWSNADVDGSIRSFHWSKTDGTSICPIGFRVPTIEEISAETSEISNSSDAYSSFLKLPVSGFADASNGNFYTKGEYGTIWSSSTDNLQSKHFGYYINGAQHNNTTPRAGAFPVRCIQD